MNNDLLTYYPLIGKVHINCLFYSFWLDKKDLLLYSIDLSSCLINNTYPKISYKKL